MGRSASRRRSQRSKVGNSSSTGSGASNKKPGAKVASGKGAESREDLVCDPTNCANIGTAEDEGHAEKRVDAADTTEDSAGVQLPELGNHNPGLVCDGNYGRADLRGPLDKIESETVKKAFAELKLASDEVLRTVQDELSKERKRRSDLKESQESAVNEMKIDFESKLRQKEEALLAKDLELQRVGSIIEEKDRSVQDLQSLVDASAGEVQKLRGQLAVVEKKSAQESLASGSYTEGGANPSLLVTAAQTVDEAMDTLTKFLYDNSLMTKATPRAPELANFIRAISFACRKDFTRAAQMKHVWGRWICVYMFWGFEHVYFDVPADRTSPLDMEKHALDCFQTYQQKKDVPSLDFYKECGFFQEFCTKMFSLVFPAYLVYDARLLDSVKCRQSGGGLGGGWEEPGELKRLFLDVAKAIWMLHELAFSFQPPASIFRIGRGEPFDEEYQEAVIKDNDNKGSMEVLLMLRPGFRVKKSVIKSRVFLAKSSASNSQAST